MNLTQHPESLCVHLEIPFPVALGFATNPDCVTSRHEMERVLQECFFRLRINAYINGGEGTLITGHSYILTDEPAKAMCALKNFFESFQVRGGTTDFLSFVHLGWLDQETKIWRTFHPLTTRPFWTRLIEPERLDEILQRGKAATA